MEGTPAIPGTDNRCQDFLTVNHPVFPFATPAEYVKLFDLRATPLVGDLLAAAWFALCHPGHLMSVMEIAAKRRQPTADVLERLALLARPTRNNRRPRREILACAPFRRDGAAWRSRQQARRLSEPGPERYLRTREAVFEFRVQPQTDPVAMPVEDMSVEWDEGVSKPIPVATLTIGVQDLDSPEGRALAEECEAMAFSPWNALAEHRPMGGINRLRQAVYLASQAKRGAKCPS